MMIGAHTPSSRSRLQVANPSMPGSITSSTTASNSWRAGHPQRVLARGREVGDDPLRLEPAAYGSRHPFVVFDDQNAHRANFIVKT